MKKPIHLYIFVVLSAIASVFRIFNTFFASFNEAEVRQVYEGMGMAELVPALEASHQLQVNLINKGFAIVLLALLVATIVFLFRKENERASYTYIAYLFGTLLFSTYSFIGAKGIIANFYTDELMSQVANQTAFVFYIINIVLFAIYFGVTIFFLLRKPKNNPSMEQTATDI